MSSDRVRAFIAAMKLRELREGRDRLAGAYDEIERAAAAAPTPEGKLAALADGLAAMQLAGQPLHPEVKNLEIARRGDAALVARWLERLRAELRRGRARADLMPALGGLLGEWLQPERGRHGASEEETQRLVDAWKVPSAETELVRLLERRIDPKALAAARRHAGEVSARFESFEGKAEGAAPAAHPDPRLDDDYADEDEEEDDDDEGDGNGRGHGGGAEEGDWFEPLALPPKELLSARGLADGTAHYAAAVAEREQGEGGPRELRSAVRLAWQDISAWDYPEDDVALDVVWTRNRFRARPSMGFLTALFVHRIGEILAKAIGPLTGRKRANHLLRLARLEELSAPQVVLDAERRHLEKAFDPFGRLGADDRAAKTPIGRSRLEHLHLSTESTYDYAQTDIAKGFAWVDTEIAWARARGLPVYVLKTDLADYFPSVSHALVRELLLWVGVEPRFVDVVMRVLSLRLPDGSRTTRGLPLGLGISGTISDLLMSVFVGAARRGRTIRAASMVDDVVMIADSPDELAAAWADFKQVVEAAGLAINEAKSGAAGIGTRLPDGVPQGPIRWGLLRHDGERFRVDDEAVAEFAAITRARVVAEDALLDRIAAYRDQLRFAMTWLAPQAALGDGHLDDVEAAIARIDPALRTMILGEIGARFLGTSGAELPEAWLHWPITAGGLGAPWPAADIVPLRLALAARHDEQVPSIAATSRTENVMWQEWYVGRAKLLEPVAPKSTPATEALVQRFLERGRKIGQPGKDLSGYWRWVLHTLGPDILDAYGSYELVGTDLVPVDVIRRAGA